MKKFIGNICVCSILCIGIYFVSISPLITPINAGCSIECEQAMCGGEGYEGKAGKNGFNSKGQRRCTVCSDVCTSDPPAIAPQVVAPTACRPVLPGCSSSCGMLGYCTDNGCGGKVCCPATAPCPTKIPPTPTPANGCFYQKVQCVRDPCEPILICPTKIPIPTPHYCMGDSQCPKGYDCIQPTMPPCVATDGRDFQGGEIMCKQVMPRQECQVSKCPKRSLGDANCDQLINEVDFLEFKKNMNNQPICLNCTVDFNNDKKVNLLDYEIWRRNK